VHINVHMHNVNYVICLWYHVTMDTCTYCILFILSSNHSLTQSTLSYIQGRATGGTTGHRRGGKSGRGGTNLVDDYADSVDSSHDVRMAKEKSSSSSANAISSAIPEVHQKLLILLHSLKYANVVGVIDEEFRPDYLALRKEALPPTYPPLNLSDHGKVWKILAYNNSDWHYFYPSSGGSIWCRTREIRHITNLPAFRENVDYFRTEQNLLEFVENQFVAHGDNYDKFVEFAEEVYSSKKRTSLITREEYLALPLGQVPTPRINPRDAPSIHI
jgi:hypothetical protein